VTEEITKKTSYSHKLPSSKL